jgi:hypothetical protein
MLSNILGTLLAFVTIMLLLSLIVTSLVQFTQATLRLRGRNLLFGVASLIEGHAPHAAPPGGKTSPLRANPHLAAAAHVLNNADASLKHLAEPNATGRVLLGPPVSWVRSDDLARAVVGTLGAQAPAAAGPSNPGSTGDSVDQVRRSFENMEPALAKRFQFIIRIWTVVWSFAIAFAFQLSTPDLLKTLPSEDAKRQAIIAAVPNLTGEATHKLAFTTDDVLEESIARLTKAFPQYADLFEQVSGDRESKQVMMDEMRNVLAGRPDREKVLDAYSTIIDAVSSNTATTAYEHTSQLIDQLDTFSISPKLNDFKYYAAREAGRASGLKIQWGHILGVLMTGILLSLGAPFWFEQLKNLSSLSDAMNPKAAAAKGK